MLVAVTLVAGVVFAFHAKRPASIAEPQDSPPAAAGVAHLPSNLQQRPTIPLARADLFAARSTPQAKPTPSTPAPVPVPPVLLPPPVPYRFVGTVARQTEEPEYLLARDNAVFAVRPGDALEGDYRVEEARASEVILVYLPLAARARLVLGSPPPMLGAPEAPVQAAQVPQPMQATAPVATTGVSVAPAPSDAPKKPAVAVTAAAGTRAAHLRRERQQLWPVIVK